jgi:hypothetical protein
MFRERLDVGLKLKRFVVLLVLLNVAFSDK